MNYLYMQTYILWTEMCVYTLHPTYQNSYSITNQNTFVCFFSGFVLLTFCDIMYHVKYEYL